MVEHLRLPAAVDRKLRCALILFAVLPILPLFDDRRVPLMAEAAPYHSLVMSESERKWGCAHACRDGIWAFVFLAHLALVGVLAYAHVPELVQDARDGLVGHNNPTASEAVQHAIEDAAQLAWPFVVGGVAVGFAWALAWIAIVQLAAKQFIPIALLLTPALFFVITVSPGNPSPIGTDIFCLMSAFYAWWILTRQRFRLEFAQLTLESVATISLLSIVLATAWQLVWLGTAAATYYHFAKRGKPLGVIALLFLALATQVILNVVHVTNAGVVATWYYNQHFISMPRYPTFGALGRATVPSLGSICLGSILIALIQLLYSIVELARAQQQEGCLSALVWCCVACCIGYLEMLVELFNPALVAATSHEQVYKHPISASGFASEAKQLCALIFVSTVSSCITSGVTTLFVCWAEDPAALAASSPGLHAKFDEISARFLAGHHYDAGPGPIGSGPVATAYYGVPPSPPSHPPPGRSASPFFAPRPSSPAGYEYEAPPDLAAPCVYAYAVPAIPIRTQSSDRPPPFAAVAAPASYMA
ncbi:plasma-membrane choline transporter-domain-containing protein [Pavlovales sp. CCMP2436]|nr:plasma-membrane choline transporter-domain-containing protein [Pavlovales sp. CCMP2436]